MKFYAVFKTTVEKHVLLDADNWQDAAKLANTMERPTVPAELGLEVVVMSREDDPELYYDAVHELVGPCNKCGFQILERGCSEHCVHQHSPSDPKYKKGGGWVSTEHGHVFWCSQGCRDADQANDPEATVLDRLAGIE